ncbi:MAG TPA: DUF1440 domain-containing protein [Blastocatellia bacterium]|nr:DUF1440 domain-containing protein [Blastocatellia bacterium]
MNRLIKGALAGLAATAPMTLAMTVMHARLPRPEQYALPPRLITEKVVEKAGGEEQLDERERRRLTLVGHFSYGLMAGACYPLLADGMKLPPVASGALYGLAVWAGSYLGWLPAVEILRPATEHPPRRTALMIAAHLIWGVTTGKLVGKVAEERRIA